MNPGWLAWDEVAIGCHRQDRLLRVHALCDWFDASDLFFFQERNELLSVDKGMKLYVIELFNDLCGQCKPLMVKSAMFLCSITSCLASTSRLTWRQDSFGNDVDIFCVLKESYLTI